MKRPALTIVILALAMVLLAGVATAQSSPCAEAPSASGSGGTTSIGTSAFEGGGCPIAYLQVLGIVGGLLMGMALMTYAMFPGQMKKAKQKRLFKFGLLPAIIFYGQTLFCASAGLLIGCSLSAATAPVGIVVGSLFFVYMVHIMKR